MAYKKVEDQNKYWKGWYQRNKTLHKKNVAIFTKKRRRELKQWLNEYKHKHGCQRCSENDPACLDFHHTEKSKEHKIANMVSWIYTKERIQKEIKKCIILCANCHRKEHYYSNLVKTA